MGVEGGERDVVTTLLDCFLFVFFCQPYLVKGSLVCKVFGHQGGFIAAAL
jgi:hypothetical protein